MTAGDVRVRPTCVRRVRVQTRDGDHHEPWHTRCASYYLYKYGAYRTKFTICWYIYLLLKIAASPPPSPYALRRPHSANFSEDFRSYIRIACVICVRRFFAKKTVREREDISLHRMQRMWKFNDENMLRKEKNIYNFFLIPFNYRQSALLFKMLCYLNFIWKHARTITI